MENETELKLKEINNFFNDAVKELKASKYPLIGRFDHLHDLSVVMARPDTPIAILLAEAGMGKTASMQAWKESEEKRTGYSVHVLTLNIGKLSGDGDSLLQERLENLIPKLKEYQDILQKSNPKSYVVLFIDEVHTVVSIFKGSKIGGDLLKRALTEEPLRTVGATTEEEYNSYIASDYALERRFKPIRMAELNSSEVQQVLRSRLESYVDKEFSSKVNDEILNMIITASKIHRGRFAEPAQSIDVLETMVGYYKVDGVDFTESLLEKVFKVQYKIDLNPKDNIKRTEEALLKRVKGQALAVFTAVRMVKGIPYQFEDLNKPPSALLSGSTGTGKTELAKAMAEGIFGDDSHLFNLNMPDFQEEGSDAEFRRIIGERVLNNPRSLILLDEIEKAHVDVQSSLLSILDEGLVSYTKKGADSYNIRKTESLRNCIILATTNAGANMYDQINKFSSINKNMTRENMNEVTKDIRREWQQISPQVNKALLADGFKPEVLARFDNIIPFRALSEATLLEITENKISQLIDDLYEYKGVSISIKPEEDWTGHGYPYKATELAMFIVMDRANQIDSKSGGARNIHRLVKSELRAEIIDAIYEYPHIKSFIATTNGDSSFENSSKTVGEGAIEIVPTSLFEEVNNV